MLLKLSFVSTGDFVDDFREVRKYISLSHIPVLPVYFLSITATYQIDKSARGAILHHVW